jgi:cardiolipin synthase
MANPANDQNSISIAITENDFLRRKSEIAISYRNAIRHSKKEIILVGAYFMPGIRVRRLLKKAIRRGVEIHCIFGAASDVMLSVYAREFLYQWMLRNGINIYEYVPSNVHGKVLICDGHWMSIGSFDLNSLSTYSNIELNLEVDDEEFVDDIRQRLISIRQKDCIEITKATHQFRNSILRQLKCWIAFQLTKTFFGLAYILSKVAPRRD